MCGVVGCGGVWGGGCVCVGREEEGRVERRGGGGKCVCGGGGRGGGREGLNVTYAPVIVQQRASSTLSKHCTCGMYTAQAVPPRRSGMICALVCHDLFYSSRHMVVVEWLYYSKRKIVDIKADLIDFVSLIFVGQMCVFVSRHLTIATFLWKNGETPK